MYMFWKNEASIILPVVTHPNTNHDKNTSTSLFGDKMGVDVRILRKNWRKEGKTILTNDKSLNKIHASSSGFPSINRI